MTLLRSILATGVVLSALTATSRAQVERPPHVHRFSSAQRWAKRFDDPARDEWQKPDAVVAAMHIAEGMTVIDVGAGTGYFESRLSKAVGPHGKVLAVDIEPNMVRYLKKRAARERWSNVEVKAVRADASDLETGLADRILIVDTWHHLDHRAAYTARLKRALKPGGSIVVVDFRREAKRGPPVEHRLSPEELARELASAGLRTNVVEIGLTDQYLVVGERSDP